MTFGSRKAAESPIIYENKGKGAWMESTITTQFTCVKCGKKLMSPNIVGGAYVRGWRCRHCKEVQYPVRDKKTNVKEAN